LAAGADCASSKVRLGHKHVTTTALYTQVATTTIAKTKSPLDRLNLKVAPSA
jgi:integrase/recombinase XerD